MVTVSVAYRIELCTAGGIISICIMTNPSPNAKTNSIPTLSFDNLFQVLINIHVLIIYKFEDECTNCLITIHKLKN